jgi:hypothetical protein
MPGTHRVVNTAWQRANGPVKAAAGSMGVAEANRTGRERQWLSLVLWPGQDWCLLAGWGQPKAAQL